jgi:2-(1,2-epoxy-1,2-dihydrophenyl)acetyl-CoA isomerase
MIAVIEQTAKQAAKAARGGRMAFETIQFERSGGVATLTLNRPDKLNSFNTQMHGEIRSALDMLEADPSVRALVLTGAGRGFCAGQDLDDRAVAPGADMPDLGASIETNYNPLVRRLRALPLPVIAAVNGVAAGAGANIALSCDIVFAARSAKFIQAFAKIGLIPDSGGTWYLPRFIGTPRALGLALTGQPLTAEQAADWGLIWQAVDDDTLQETAQSLARQFATGPTRGYAAIKQAITAGAATLDAQLDLERDVQRALGASQDYREGVSAFLAKRAPNFTGQ